LRARTALAAPLVAPYDRIGEQPLPSAMNTQRANLAGEPGPGPTGSIPIGLASGERWFAVNTLPLAETRAERNLSNQGFRTFMPRRRKMLRHARKMTLVEAPLFPHYLFVAFDPRRDPWRRINSTFGVARLVMGGEAPHPVPVGIVEALIAATVNGGIVDLAAQLRAGSPVRVMAGPFADQLALLEQLDGSGRACILLDILGRQVRATTERCNLMPAG
jgi:transcription elongation factor/antiterminator RfaH